MTGMVNSTEPAISSPHGMGRLGLMNASSHTGKVASALLVRTLAYANSFQARM